MRLSDDCEQDCRKAANKVLDVRQGYLIGNGKTSVRIRVINDKDYYLTVKHRINGHCVEIETDISRKDFNSLWSSTTNHIHKTRYLIGGWDVDFFYYKDYRYFAIAEIELPEDQDMPKSIPSIFSDYIVYLVSIDDNRFTSRKLSDVTYAKKLFNQIVEKKDG
jgi:CYTH domain-containing protein